MSKKDTHALKIHRQFVGLCDNVGCSRILVRFEKGKPVVRRGRKTKDLLVGGGRVTEGRLYGAHICPKG